MSLVISVKYKNFISGFVEFFPVRKGSVTEHWPRETRYIRQVRTLMVMMMMMMTVNEQKPVTSRQHAGPQFRGRAHVLACVASRSYFEITDCPMKTFSSHKEC